MVVRISGDFWGNFNDGENLRSTFLLSPEHIFSLDKSPDHILRPYFTPEHRDFAHYLDHFELTKETLLRYTDEFTESMHSQLRQFEEFAVWQ